MYCSLTGWWFPYTVNISKCQGQCQGLFVIELEVCLSSGKFLHRQKLFYLLGLTACLHYLWFIELMALEARLACRATGQRDWTWIKYLTSKSQHTRRQKFQVYISMIWHGTVFGTSPWHFQEALLQDKAAKSSGDVLGSAASGRLELAALCSLELCLGGPVQSVEVEEPAGWLARFGITGRLWLVWSFGLPSRIILFLARQLPTIQGYEHLHEVAIFPRQSAYSVSRKLHCAILLAFWTSLLFGFEPPVLGGHLGRKLFHFPKTGSSVCR